MKVYGFFLSTLSLILGSVEGLAGNEVGREVTRTASLTDRRALLTGLLTSAAATATWGYLGKKPAFAVQPSPSDSSLTVAQDPSGDLQDVYFGVGCFCTCQAMTFCRLV